MDASKPSLSSLHAQQVNKPLPFSPSPQDDNDATQSLLSSSPASPPSDSHSVSGIISDSNESMDENDSEALIRVTHVIPAITQTPTVVTPASPIVIETSTTAAVSASSLLRYESTLPNTGKASLMVSTFNLTCNLIGSGMLAMPWAFKEISVFSGLILLSIIALANGFTMLLLAKCCEMARSANYQVLGTRALGAHMGKIIQIFMLFYTFSSCLSYVILIGDFIPNAISAARSDLFGLDPDKLRLYVILAVSVVILLPLSFIKNLYSLRFTSAISLLSILFTAGLTLSSLGGHTNKPASVSLFSYNVCSWAALSIFNVAFTAHYNGPRFYLELHNRSLRRFAVVVFSAMGCALCIYACMGVAGYWRFGDDTVGNILNNYDSGYALAIAARLALAIGVSCSFPLCFHAIRSSIFSLFFPNLLISANQRLNNPKYVIVTVTLVAINVVLGIVLKQLEVVMIYKGSIFGANVVYVFPALMYIYLLKKQRERIERKRARRKGAAAGIGSSKKSRGKSVEGTLGSVVEEEEADIVPSGLNSHAAVAANGATFRGVQGLTPAERAIADSIPVSYDRDDDYLAPAASAFPDEPTQTQQQQQQQDLRVPLLNGVSMGLPESDSALGDFMSSPSTVEQQQREEAEEAAAAIALEYDENAVVVGLLTDVLPRHKPNPATTVYISTNPYAAATSSASSTTTTTAAEDTGSYVPPNANGSRSNSRAPSTEEEPILPHSSLSIDSSHSANSSHHSSSSMSRNSASGNSSFFNSLRSHTSNLFHIDMESRPFQVMVYCLLVWGVSLGIVGLVVNIIRQSGGLPQCE